MDRLQNVHAEIGTDGSGLDQEWREEIEESVRKAKSGPLGKLGTSGYMKVIPEYYKNQDTQGEK